MKHTSAKSLGAVALGAAFVISSAGSAAALTGGQEGAAVGDALQDTTAEARDTAGDLMESTTDSLHSIAGDHQAMERLSGVPQEYGSTVADEPLAAQSPLADGLSEIATNGNHSPSVQGNPLSDVLGTLGLDNLA